MGVFTTGLWWSEGTGRLQLEPEVYIMVSEQRWGEGKVFHAKRTLRQERTEDA